MTAKAIDKIINKAIKDNEISEQDRVAAKTILVWANMGKKAARKISKECVTNLETNGFTNKRGRLCGDIDNPMWIFLAIAGAHNYIQQIKT